MQMNVIRLKCRRWSCSGYQAPLGLAVMAVLGLLVAGCETDNSDKPQDYYREGQFSLGSPSRSASQPSAPGNGAADEPLSVSAVPASLELTADGDITVLNATGGNAPYAWSVQYPSRGNVSSATGSSVIYTRNDSGNNVVKLTDDSGETLHIVITQP